jgi:caffeoyl-CoA O-methyltransferase
MPAKGQFDFVFLDADKPAYPAYYDLIVPRMKPGALLLIDNMLLGGDVVHPDDERSRAIDALNGRIARDDRVDSALVLIADGVTFVRKRL